jgi:thiamine biosynthesis lipoprotein
MADDAGAMDFRRSLVLGLLCALCGCNRARDDAAAQSNSAVEPASTKPAAPAAPAAQPALAAPAPGAEAAAGAVVHQRTRPLMGTVIAITVMGGSEAKVVPAMDAALDEIARLEAVLSEWRPESEISRINAAAGDKPVAASADTIAVIKAGIEIGRWSEGAFDLSWAALRGMYLFQPGQERVPDPAELRKRLPLIDYRKVRVDERAGTVMLTKKGMALGTGGIAKGYALDRAGAVLKAAGFENFMIFGGGQIQVSGTKNGRPWRVGIQHPRKDDYFAFVEATSGSIATAGDYEHSFIKDGKRWHHIIDTKTGMPVTHTMSVTVVAESGLAADAVDTAIFVMGAERALKVLDRAPFKVDAVIVDKDLRLHANEGMQKRLVMRAELQDGKLPGVAQP